MNRRASRHGELKAIAEAGQVSGMVYQILPIYGVGDGVDAATELALFVCFADFSSGVHGVGMPLR
jgi:hypothetical protein